MTGQVWYTEREHFLSQGPGQIAFKPIMNFSSKLPSQVHRSGFSLLFTHEQAAHSFSKRAVRIHRGEPDGSCWLFCLAPECQLLGSLASSHGSSLWCLLINGLLLLHVLLLSPTLLCYHTATLRPRTISTSSLKHCLQPLVYGQGNGDKTKCCCNCLEAGSV